MDAVILLLAGVAALNIYAVVLVVARSVAFRVKLYRPMLVNVGLSLAPGAVLVLILLVLDPVADSLPAPVDALVWLVGGALWLLLLPNSAYLITELNFSHRRRADRVPLWFDIVLTLALAVSGSVNAVLNVVLAQLLYVVAVHPHDTNRFDDPDSWLMSLVVLAAVSFGIYLGRHVRVNSWDILNPVRLGRAIAGQFASPGTLAEAAGFTLVHMLFLTGLYLVVAAPVMVSTLVSISP